MKLFEKFDSKKIKKIELNLLHGGCKATTYIEWVASPGHHQVDSKEITATDYCTGSSV